MENSSDTNLKFDSWRLSGLDRRCSIGAAYR